MNVWVCIEMCDCKIIRFIMQPHCTICHNCACLSLRDLKISGRIAVIGYKRQQKQQQNKARYRLTDKMPVPALTQV